MTTIIFSHPWHGSFNKAILDNIIEKCNDQNIEYQVIDLHKDNFNPSFSEQDLSIYNKGKSNDPLITKYQEIISQTKEIIFIFPIWWGTMPAILKGFFDKVMLVDFAFNYENGWTPLLNINKSLVVTTSASPSDMFENSIENCFIAQCLNSIGINNTKWLNCENVDKGGNEYRKEFIKTVSENI